MAGIPFNATLFFFGTNELVGHLPVYGAMLVLLVYGSDPRLRPAVSALWPFGRPRVTDARAGIPHGMSFETIRYDTDGPIATITLEPARAAGTRSSRRCPTSSRPAIGRATRDSGRAGLSCCAARFAVARGFDFAGGFHHYADEQLRPTARWDAGKDFVMAWQQETGPVPKFMSIGGRLKPVVAQVHGWCVGGGSDMALCADIVIVVRRRGDRDAVRAHVGRITELACGSTGSG